MVDITIQKQPLFRVVPLPKDLVLISRKKHPSIYFERIHKLLMSGDQKAVIQATGACIERAVDICLQIEQKYTGITLEVDTFTMPCSDQIKNQTTGQVDEKTRLINGINRVMMKKKMLQLEIYSDEEDELQEQFSSRVVSRTGQNSQTDSPQNIKIDNTEKEKSEFGRELKVAQVNKIKPLQIDVEDLKVLDFDQQQPEVSSAKALNRKDLNRLRLEESQNSIDFSCDLGSQGIKMPLQNYEIGLAGMRNIKTGELIGGNMQHQDLEYGEVLGNGASGYVYAATHKPTGVKVALKQINVFDKHKRHQMVNDLRSLSKNECPFLVKFYGALFEEGTVKVALEMMDMGSIKDIIKMAKMNPEWREGRPLVPEAVISKITQQILAGLSYLNICMRQMHRDIKPDNILCNSLGFVKLTDFGITKQMDEELLAGTFVGTMPYMSPERMEGEKYSFEADIWSLGIILIELVTGSYPFQDTNKGFLQMLDQIKYDPSPTLPQNGNFSPQLTELIDLCLQKEERHRPSTLTLLAHPFILNHSQSQADLPRYFAKLRQFKNQNQR